MKELTKEDIQKVVNDFFSKKEERKVKMFSYCKQKLALVDRGSFNLSLCDDENCKSCRQFEKMFKEEIEKL